MSINFIRIAEAARKLGVTRQSVHVQAKRGTFPPLLKLGERAVGILDSEFQELLRARLRGDSLKEIKALVARMVEDRRALADSDARL